MEVTRFGVLEECEAILTTLGDIICNRVEEWQRVWPDKYWRDDSVFSAELYEIFQSAHYECQRLVGERAGHAFSSQAFRLTDYSIFDEWDWYVCSNIDNELDKRKEAA